MTDINILIKYNEWSANVNADLRAELLEIADDREEITDRFYKDLQFGTAGLRGKMGAGTNRMNVHTVARAAAGLAETLENRSVVIGYDNRINSLLFAKTAANVMAADGIKVYLFKEMVPTPVLSFAVRYLQCGAGIMITASHNGREYNGFKCYGADGCQMTDAAADEVLSAMAEIEYFEQDIEGDDDFQYVADDVIESYYQQVLAQSLNPELLAESDLRVLYTPLNGTGSRFVPEILRRCGVKNLQVVAEQSKADGNFTTCPKPNPEEKSAFDLSLKYAENADYDLILATDPDADRFGTLVKFGDQYRLLDGNEIGCLLLDYILRDKKQKGNLSENAVVIKTVVTAPMAEKIAEAYGCRVQNLLVGFKYICEQVKLLAENGHAEDFVFGFEESNGYLCGNYTGDKDGVLSAMLFAEMSAYYKANNMTPVNRLNQLYHKFGAYYFEMENIAFEGKNGLTRQKSLLKKLHNEPLKALGDRNVVRYADYLSGRQFDYKTGDERNIDLPKNDMLEYVFEDGCSLVIRPSGTEPKLKIYYFAAAETFGLSKKWVEAIKSRVQKVIEPYLG